jgi:hypothetical protein
MGNVIARSAADEATPFGGVPGLFVRPLGGDCFVAALLAMTWGEPTPETNSEPL